MVKTLFKAFQLAWIENRKVELSFYEKLLKIFLNFSLKFLNFYIKTCLILWNRTPSIKRIIQKLQNGSLKWKLRKTNDYSSIYKNLPYFKNFILVHLQKYRGHDWNFHFLPFFLSCCILTFCQCFWCIGDISQCSS